MCDLAVESSSYKKTGVVIQKKVRLGGEEDIIDVSGYFPSKSGNSLNVPSVDAIQRVYQGSSVSSNHALQQGSSAKANIASTQASSTKTNDVASNQGLSANAHENSNRTSNSNRSSNSNMPIMGSMFDNSPVFSFLDFAADNA